MKIVRASVTYILQLIGFNGTNQNDWMSKINKQIKKRVGFEVDAIKTVIKRRKVNCSEWHLFKFYSNELQKNLFWDVSYFTYLK